ncbi:hypothetical protein OGM84_03525 [Pediococcus acidilactici]
MVNFGNQNTLGTDPSANYVFVQVQHCLSIGNHVAIDLDQPHLYPSDNWQNTLLECVNANDVTDTIVDGQFLMRNRQVLTLDQERIMAEARNYACPL